MKILIMLAGLSATISTNALAVGNALGHSLVTMAVTQKTAIDCLLAGTSAMWSDGEERKNATDKEQVEKFREIALKIETMKTEMDIFIQKLKATKNPSIDSKPSE